MLRRRRAVREVHGVRPRAHPALEHPLLALRTAHALQLRRAGLVAAQELRLSAGWAHAARAGQGRFVDANALPTMKITPTPRRIEQLKGPYCGRGLNKFKRGVNVTVAIFQVQKARSYDALIEIYFTAKLQPRVAPVHVV